MGVPAGYRVIAEMPYKPQPLARGYTGQTLYVNVGNGKIEARPVTQQMKDVFIGGKGFGLWRLWNAVTSKTQWNDPENAIVVSSGPVGGTTAYAGSGKVPRGFALAPHRTGHRLQRRRLLRPVPEVLRLGRARDPGQDARGRRRVH